MKIQILCFLLSFAILGLAGCSSNDSADSPRARAGSIDARSGARADERRESGDDDKPSDEPIGRKPKVGMSKAQIESMYGEPKTRSFTSRGEVWHYWFNRGHAFIPYNFGYRPRMGTFIFDAGGRLAEFNYNE